ncbi:LysR substrate-binding domain-containing protein [Bauldia sp.]|uniref:LysR substrate-binding domain-containing protein n=1 Tax=Bauldia sp. TaxID=2575872 RepID=UPI003BA84E96
MRKAREILALVSEATREVEGATAGGVNQGSIRVGATDTVIGYFLGPILARFKARFPRINAQVVQLERPEIESGLIDGELDIAVILVSNLRRREALTSSILLPSQRRLWLPPRHALLAKKQVSLADVAKEPYIMLTVDEAEKSALGYWQRHSLKPDTILRTANVEAVRTMVALGMGVSILSDMVFRPWSLEGDRIEVRDLVEHIPSMDIGLAWRLGATLSPAADEFRAFLQSSYVRPT